MMEVRGNKISNKLMVLCKFFLYCKKPQFVTVLVRINIFYVYVFLKNDLQPVFFSHFLALVFFLIIFFVVKDMFYFYFILSFFFHLIICADINNLK